jgi:xanthosine utilization system XapX-like protein
MKPQVKSGIEYAVITLLVAGLCVWQLLGAVNDDEPPPAKIALLGLGMLIAGSMHCVFMMQLVRRTGRSFWPWFIAVVVFMPIGSAVLLALLLGDTDSADS